MAASRPPGRLSLSGAQKTGKNACPAFRGFQVESLKMAAPATFSPLMESIDPATVHRLSPRGGPGKVARLGHARHVHVTGLRRDGDARPELETATRLDPASSEPWYLLGLIEKSAGNAEASVQMLKKSAALDPELRSLPSASGICVREAVSSRRTNPLDNKPEL